MSNPFASDRQIDGSNALDGFVLRRQARWRRTKHLVRVRFRLRPELLRNQTPDVTNLFNGKSALHLLILHPALPLHFQGPERTVYVPELLALLGRCRLIAHAGFLSGAGSAPNDSAQVRRDPAKPAVHGGPHSGCTERPRSVETISVASAVVAAVVAVVVGFWSFRAVVLSKKQLKIAQDEATALEARNNMKPALFMTLNGSIDTRVQVADGGMIYLEVHIDNLGDEPAQHITVDIDLPLEMVDRHENAQVPDGEKLIAFAHNNGTHATLQQKPDTVLVQKSKPLYVGTMALGFKSPDAYKALPDTITIPWRVASAEGSWQNACSALIEPHQEQWFETPPPPISTE